LLPKINGSHPADPAIVKFSPMTVTSCPPSLGPVLGCKNATAAVCTNSKTKAVGTYTCSEDNEKVTRSTLEDGGDRHLISVEETIEMLEDTKSPNLQLLTKAFENPDPTTFITVLPSKCPCLGLRSATRGPSTKMKSVVKKMTSSSTNLIRTSILPIP
jgi:hypothetical protein